MNNWLGEEGKIGYRSFHFIFNNACFFISCTEQSTKEIMKLFHEEDVILIILQTNGKMMFPKQLSSHPKNIF